MPPKKKGKKAKQRQREEEERRRQEELARQEAEELRRIQEEEQRRREEEERILAYETQTREEQQAELKKYLENVAVLHHQNRVQGWEKKRWDDYMYKTKEMDTIDVKVVNTFITNWDDDRDNDIEKIFHRIHQCLEIIDDISSALSAFPLEDTNTRELWNEGISNLKGIIAKKLDYASFMLLKDANKYLNDKTQNMEYGVLDGDGIITLCLWANMHRAARKQGVDILGYSFQIPAHLAAEDCAVRIMHLAFNHISPEVLEPVASEEVESDSIVIDVIGPTEAIEENKILEDKISDEEPKLERTESKVLENDEVIDANTSDPKDSHDEFRAGSGSQVVKRISLVVKQLLEQTIQDVADNAMKDESCPSPVLRHGKQLLSPREYFAVGGILHFDLFKVPKITIQKEGITYIYKQDPILEKIGCERENLNSSSADDRPSYNVLGSIPNLDQENSKETSKQPENGEDEPMLKTVKDKEDKHNSSSEVGRSPSHEAESLPNHNEGNDKDNLKLKIQIPSNVVFFEQPQPALFCPERKGFTIDGISKIEYDPASRQISFMPNQFGIFGLFQKKYINFPYKSWNVKSGEIVELSLTGQHISLNIQISDEGYRIESMNPTKTFDLTEVSSAWLTAEQLNEELLSIGINIFVDETAGKFIGIPSKNQKMEYDIYDHMALLSQHCDFDWSKWNSQLPHEELVLKFRSHQTKVSKVFVFI